MLSHKLLQAVCAQVIFSLQQTRLPQLLLYSSDQTWDVLHQPVLLLRFSRRQQCIFTRLHCRAVITSCPLLLRTVSIAHWHPCLGTPSMQ